MFVIIQLARRSWSAIR